MKEEDADILFATKIDWAAVYTDNKIYCTEAGCDYVTELTRKNEDLKIHLRIVYEWGDWPCLDQNCEFIGHSKVCQLCNAGSHVYVKCANHREHVPHFTIIFSKIEICTKECIKDDQIDYSQTNAQ